MLSLLLACVGGGGLFGGRDDDAGGDTWDPEDVAGAPLPGGFLYQRGTIHDFALELSPEARASLASDPRAPVAATFRWGEETYTVSAHIKGRQSLRDLDGKPSWKIDFHDFDPDATFHGVRRLTLNNMIQDGSMLAEAGAYRLYAAMGLPAPRHGYARLAIDGEPYGLYAIVETPDEQFLDRFASDEGNLYAGGYGGDVSRGNAENFELEEAGDAGEPYTDLEALCDALDAPADWWATLGQLVDRDALLGMWAAEIVSGQGDGYLGWANNFLLYNDVGAGRWVMIPWGTDQAFRTDMRVGGDWRGDLAVACLLEPDCVAALRARVDDALAAWEDADLPGWLERQADVIHADCQADVRTEIPCRYTQDKVLDFAVGRAAQLGVRP